MARVIKADDLNVAGAARAAVLDLLDLAKQASQIVLDARKEAAAILAAAREQSGKLRQDAIDAGKAEGFAQGMQEGLSQGRQQAAQQVQTELDSQTKELAELATTIVQELGRSRIQMLSAMRREMLEFSLELAAKIVGEVAVSDIAAAHANLAKVLALVGRSGDIILKVNPGQLRRLQEKCNELTSALAIAGPVRLVGDEEISPGGVKLISRSGEIDATIQTQLRNVAQSVLGGIGKLFESQPQPAPSQVQGQYEPLSQPADAVEEGAI